MLPSAPIFISRIYLSCVHYLARGLKGPDSMIMTALGKDSAGVSPTQSTRNDVIAQICEGTNGSCFAEIQRIQTTNFRALRTLSREPEICISEPAQSSGSSQVLYCLPAFDVADAAHKEVDFIDEVRVCYHCSWLRRTAGALMSLSQSQSERV